MNGEKRSACVAIAVAIAVAFAVAVAVELNRQTGITGMFV